MELYNCGTHVRSSPAITGSCSFKLSLAFMRKHSKSQSGAKGSKIQLQIKCNFCLSFEVIMSPSQLGLPTRNAQGTLLLLG